MTISITPQNYIPSVIGGIDDLTVDGTFFQGGASVSSGGEIFNITQVDNRTSGRPLMTLFENAINPSSAPGATTDYHCIDAKTYGSSANINANVRFFCIEGKSFSNKTTGNVGMCAGVMGSAINSAAGTINIASSLFTDVRNQSTGVITQGNGVHIASGLNLSSGSITELNGLYIENQTAGVTNNAIKTGTGRISFFSNVVTPAGGTTGVGVCMGNTTNLGVFFGSGVPTLSAAQGSLYLRTDGSSTSTRLYVNTNGTTGWTNVTTAT